MRTRLSACLRKRSYLTAADARADAAAAGLPLLPYRCDRCRRIHLTSRRKGKRVPRPKA